MPSACPREFHVGSLEEATAPPTRPFFPSLGRLRRASEGKNGQRDFAPRSCLIAVREYRTSCQRRGLTERKTTVECGDSSPLSFLSRSDLFSPAVNSEVSLRSKGKERVAPRPSKAAINRRTPKRAR